jgi:hypothetical protein
MIYADLEAIENALAAIDAADEAARLIALRATNADDLAEADLIRQKLAWLWLTLDAERQSYRRKT